MKIKYKKYPRVYEKVFTSDECLAKFSLDDLETDYPGGAEAYINKFRSNLYELDRFYFQKMVEYYWLQRRFVYEKIRKKDHTRTFIRTDTAYSTFVKHHLGFNYQLMTSTFIFGKTVSYFENFFGEIDEHNPFEEPEYFAFPYEHIGLAHLTLVYQMDERLDLLKEAEEQRMSYYDFLDFVINYINCVNDEMGKQVFNLYRPLTGSSFYIQNFFKKGRTIGMGKGVKNTKSVRRKPYEYKKYEIKTSNVREHEVQ